MSIPTMDSDRNYPKPDASELLAALDQTGFLLEQRVAQKLGNRGMDVDTNFAYKDSATGKSREIDVSATMDRYVGDSTNPSALLLAELIIECKNTLNPFVVVGQQSNHLPLGTHGYNAEFDPLALEFGGNRMRTHQKLGFFQLPGHTNDSKFVGTQLVRMNLQSGKWKATNDGIFDGIVYPLAKAQKARFGNDFVALNDPAEVGTPCFVFYYPILITAGPIYTVAVEGSETTVKEVDWAPVIRDLREEDLSGTFRIEVVRFEKFESYLDARVNRLFDSLERTIISNARYFDPHWLLENLGKPVKQDLYDAWLSHRH